jgi:hypothetical protein
MDATRQVFFRPSARAGVIGTALAVGILVLTSIQASAATVIGTASATPGVGCRYLDTVQLSSAGISFAVPAPGGQITQWSTLALTNVGPAGLLVWRPTATPGTFTLVAATTPVPLVAGPNTFNLTTPIPVNAGDLLGLRSEGPTDCAANASAGNLMGFHVGPTPGTGLPEAFITDQLPLTLNVTATVGPVPTTTPPPTGGGTGSGGNGGGQDQSGNQSGEGSTPVTTKSNPPPAKTDPGQHQDSGHHKKVKGTPTETHSESAEAQFLITI